MIYVSRASGLLEPFTVPEITIDAAIDRGWERDGRLLLPRPAEYLQTYPLPGALEVPAVWHAPMVDPGSLGRVADLLGGIAW